jgi:hypothetical protein
MAQVVSLRPLTEEAQVCSVRVGFMSLGQVLRFSCVNIYLFVVYDALLEAGLAQAV